MEGLGYLSVAMYGNKKRRDSRKELFMSESTTRAQHRSWRDNLRALLIGLFITVGTLGLSLYVVVYWAEKQVFTTDNWVELVSPLPKNEAVANSLGNYITDQIFNEEDVQKRVSNALPPEASFLAGPLTQQLEELTTRASQRFVSRDAFQTIWAGANRIAMERLLSTARGDTPPLQAKVNEKFNLNLSDTTGELKQILGTASEAIPALQPASEEAVVVATDLRTRADTLRRVVRTTDNLAALLPAALLASFLVALALSKRRRRTALTISVVVIVAMLLELVGIKWLRQETLDLVNNPSNLSAVGYIYDTLVQWLKEMTYVVLGVAFIVGGFLVVAGPSRWARTFRSYLRTERIQSSRFVASWRSMRQWVKRNEYYVWLGAIILTLAYTALVATVDGRTAINISLLIVSMIALVHIIATPPRKLTSSGARKTVEASKNGA